VSVVYRIRAFYPNFFSDYLIAYVCLRLVRNFNTREVAADVMGLCSNDTVAHYKKRRSLAASNGRLVCGDAQIERRIYYDAVPSIALWSVLARTLDYEQIRAIAEYRYCRRLRGGDIAYLWPDGSVQLYRRLRDMGYTVVSERINTLRATARAILGPEFAALGLPASHGITDRSMNEEVECMKLSDYIFSPSPAVTRSILAAGIPEERVVPTSYGLRSREVLDISSRAWQPERITAIFVGSICVRKGVHLLLRAWELAAVRGELLLVGKVADEMRELFREYLARDASIKHLGFVDDLTSVYRTADFFILPSLEEGSPLVTYLALGASLPVIVSEMGGGGVIEHMSEGFVVDPHDEASLVDSIRRLASDPDLRRRMGSAAGERAAKYTWEAVAERRLRELTVRVPPLEATRGW